VTARRANQWGRRHVGAGTLRAKAVG
jgi:hypothetical protein